MLTWCCTPVEDSVAVDELEALHQLPDGIARPPFAEMPIFHYVVEQVTSCKQLEGH